MHIELGTFLVRPFKYQSWFLKYNQGIPTTIQYAWNLKKKDNRLTYDLDYMFIIYLRRYTYAHI